MLATTFKGCRVETGLLPDLGLGPIVFSWPKNQNSKDEKTLPLHMLVLEYKITMKVFNFKATEPDRMAAWTPCTTFSLRNLLTNTIKKIARK